MENGTRFAKEKATLGGSKTRHHLWHILKGTMNPINLTLWLGGTLLLGLAVLGLMFAFVKACEKV